MSEKKKITIVAIKENPWKDKIYYNCITATGQEYSSTDAQVKQFLNVEHEFDVNESNGKAYINFPKGGQGGGGGGFSKKPFIPSFKDSRDAVVLSSKTMVLSYCKDVVCKQIETQLIKPETAWDKVKEGYAALLPLLALDTIKDPTPAPPMQPQGSVPGEPHTHPPLTAMLVEIKALPSIPAFANWWNSHTSSIKALTSGDRAILLSEKAKKMEELEHDQRMPDSDEIPF